MKNLAALACALTLFSAAPAAHAAKGLKTGPVALDPALGYVMVRIGPTTGKKFKAPALFLWRFDATTNEVRTRKKKDLARVPKGEDESVSFGDRVFLAGEKTSVFIASVTPGDWVIHGGPKTCLCLGSYRFTVAPGQVTDLGTVMIGVNGDAVSAPEFAQRQLAPDLAERGYAIPEEILVKPAADGDIVPPELAQLKVTRADLIPDVRFTNRGGLRYLYYGGLLVNRALGLPQPVSGDGKAIVDRIQKTSTDTEIVAKPVLEGEEPKPVPDAEAVAPAPAA